MRHETQRRRGLRAATWIVWLGGGMLGLSGRAAAQPTRTEHIPNGEVHSCLHCHYNPGGFARNPFGFDIELDFRVPNNLSGLVDWGPELAALDSDGDGCTNGEELGDPEGAWRMGDPDPIAEIVTSPGDPTSVLEACAVPIEEDSGRPEDEGEMTGAATASETTGGEDDTGADSTSSEPSADDADDQACSVSPRRGASRGWLVGLLILGGGRRRARARRRGRRGAGS